MSNNQAQQQALTLRDSFEFEPTSLITYQSAGRVIVVGDDEALKLCADLPAGFEFEPLSSTENSLRIDGYLGAYVVEVTDRHGNSSTHKADLILDLHGAALLTREMLPPGYFHVTAENRDLTALTEELAGLRGEFQKPKYFDYDPSICAHGVNGKIACRQCIDACPAAAIESIGERIEVNPYLCQGGGSCTTVCPSGAIRYLYPNLRDNGKRMRDTLREYLQQGGKNPIILFHSENYTPDTYLQAYANVLPFGVEELASVGMDLCLSALAYGAMQVILHVDEQVPRSSSNNLAQQVDWIQQLLIGIGLDRYCVSLCAHDAALPEIDTPHDLEASILDMPQAKRSAIYQALDHLVAKSMPPTDRIDLPVPAPFGEVVIDAAKCTLCMACVGSCPGRALQDGSNREVPEVFFIENNCLQCGACVQTCPEDAIVLNPRLLFDHEIRNRARALNSDTPFACIACGKPFAPTSVIHKMQDKLKDHHMFGSERALDRLKMCEDCRVVDVVQDPDAMGGEFNPLKRFQ
jgi:ferredoxin